MKKIFKFIEKLQNLALLYCVVTIFSSCSSLMKKMATDTTADVADAGQNELLELRNWEQIKVAIPSNLAFLETMLASSPHNKILLGQLIKGYAAAGFIVAETQMLITETPQKNYWKQEAQNYYLKALSFAERFFAQEHIAWAELMQKSASEADFQSWIQQHFGSVDKIGLFFSGQALAGLINLNRSDVKLITSMSLAKNLIDSVCINSPDFEAGLCQIFTALYHWSRPVMLGGQHQKARGLIQELEQLYPQNMFYPVLAAQYAYLPKGQTEEWTKVKQKVQNILAQEEKVNLPVQENSLPKGLYLYNTVAKIRFEYLMAHEKELLFE